MAFVARDGVSIHKAIISLYKAGFHKVIKDLFSIDLSQERSQTYSDINTLSVKISLIT